MAGRVDVPETLIIREFDINTMARDSTIMLLSKRRGGKSFMIRDIMYHFRHIPQGVVVSGTEKCSPFFKYFVPDLYISYEYNPKTLENLFKNQEAIIHRDGGRNDSNNVFIIMDDVMSDSGSWKTDKQFRELFFNGRHYGCFSILSSQDILGIPPALRGNVDYVFIFRNNIRTEQEKIWKNYAGIIPTFKMFRDILEQMTEDHTCLIINNNTTSNKLEDMVFYYKACPDHGDFRVGSKSFWSLHDKRCKDESTELPTNEYHHRRSRIIIKD